VEYALAAARRLLTRRPGIARFAFIERLGWPHQAPNLLAAYAAAFERGAVYTPHAVSYVRQSPKSYGAAGSRSSAQLGVLRAWLEVTRQPGWERRRAALVAAAIWPDYRLRAVRALVEDRSYVTLRLARRLVWLSIWTKLAPVFGTGFRRWVRAARTQYRRWLLHTQ